MKNLASINPESSKLGVILADYVALINKDFGWPVSKELEILMATSLLMFVEKSVDKFMRGQLDHGGDLRERDLKREILQEQIDLFWYSQAQIWPAKKIN